MYVYMYLILCQEFDRELNLNYIRLKFYCYYSHTYKIHSPDINVLILLTN